MDLLGDIRATTKERKVVAAGGQQAPPSPETAEGEDLYVDDEAMPEPGAAPAAVGGDVHKKDGKSSKNDAAARQANREALKAFLASTAEHTMPLIGLEEDTQQPLSKYVKIRLLGNGAYGEAWLCRERKEPVGSTKPYVVAKTMNLPRMSAKELLYAQSEIQCLSAVNHANVVKFIASQCNETQLVIVMEFADAGDLRRHIKTRLAVKNYLSESEAMLLFIQVLMAVEHIHANSMLHRDLKTANVLIASSGLVKVADFGFSRRYEGTVSHAVAKTFCGTPYYLAPELWNNKRYSNKAEVWSLGVLLYELLALQRPFNSNNIKGLMEQVCSGKYTPLPSSYSPAAHQLIQTLLQLDASKRPTTLEIFLIPYVFQQFETLMQLVGENPHIPEGIKNAWKTDAENLKKKVQNLQAKRSGDVPSASASTVSLGTLNANVPMGVPGAVNSAIRYEGSVQKLTAGASNSWGPKFLSLENGSLHLCEAQNSHEGRRSLPIEILESVTRIPENVAKRPFVFAIHTKDSKCTWLQAANEEQQLAWVKWIQVAMGVLC